MIDEYGDAPNEKGSHLATIDTVLPDKMIHHRGTSHGPGGSTTFWLYGPRPYGVSIADWDRITQDKWNRAFARRE
jgi:hypothetical protein